MRRGEMPSALIFDGFDTLKNKLRTLIINSNIIQYQDRNADWFTIHRYYYIYIQGLGISFSRRFIYRIGSY